MQKAFAPDFFSIAKAPCCQSKWLRFIPNRDSCCLYLNGGTNGWWEYVRYHELHDGTYVVRTNTICKARGYRKGTPVEVHIKNGNVVKVLALKNEETVPYFARVKQFLLPLYNNLKVSKAKKLTKKTQVDGCTGATYSTKAVQKNISAALEYYEKHK